RWFRYQPNTKAATLIFGLFHGMGLATKILEYELPPDGLLVNLISFNIGVEIGQILALVAILIGISYWRKSESFMRQAYTANAVIMMLGFLLMGYQITGYAVS
ncbi:MAG: HupE/UreJ family protein, partial [Gammaproteobacteria bacterium]|nr:HupE/UreJ family protein [Gammaproteobacteria bacterium]